MSAPLELSLVIPVYNERDNLPVLFEEIGRALAGRAGGEPYEIVAVDDGSTDGSLDVLKVLKREHPEIHIVALAANAGQSAAFGAGFGAARGRVIVTLDADLQNDPADIPVLVAELERSGAAAVVGYRVDRRDSGWKRLQSRIANRVRNRLIRETIRDTGCSRCRCSTACTASCPRSSGCRGGRSPRCPCTTGAAASGGRSTGCGTAYSAP